jgi:hypothetical protein
VSTDLASRYGTGRKHRLPLAIAIVVGVAFLAWLVWAIQGQSDPQVSSAMVSFKVVDAHQARATFQVRLKSASVHATCRLDATASDHTTVGELDLDVPPGTGGTFNVTRTLRTEYKATTVELEGCTAPGQKKPR